MRFARVGQEQFCCWQISVPECSWHYTSGRPRQRRALRRLRYGPLSTCAPTQSARAQACTSDPVDGWRRVKIARHKTEIDRPLPAVNTTADMYELGMMRTPILAFLKAAGHSTTYLAVCLQLCRTISAALFTFFGTLY